jgi:hypothetical protein
MKIKPLRHDRRGSLREPTMLMWQKTDTKASEAMARFMAVEPFF